jgi:hypothetical protein
MRLRLRRRCGRRTRLGRPQEDRLAQPGAERLAVEDYLAPLALDGDLVGFLDMDTVKRCAPSARPG